MASTMRKPTLEYFSQPEPRLQQNNIRASYGWDPIPFTDSALVSSDSCDSTLPSPTSPDALVFPPTTLALPKDEFGPALKTDQSFNLGTFEDWMRWDDPSDAALSPTSDFFPELKLEPSSPTMSGLELQGSGVGSAMNDDTAMFGDDTLTEAPLFQTLNAMPNELPSRENLYSTPLSWARPTPSRRPNTYMNTLLPHEETALRNIAMPPQPFPGSPSSTSSPEASESTHTRKRKSSAEEDELDHEDEEEEGSPPPHTNGRNPPVKKTAHNMIEKRYRTNLNDKIAALRDSVPSLRVMSKKNSRNGEGIEEDLQGLTPAHKLNKATVLSKATEYIAHLEKRNRYLQKENSALKGRVDAFEILVMARQQGGQMQQQRMGRQQQQQRGFGGLEGMSGMM